MSTSFFIYFKLFFYLPIFFFNKNYFRTFIPLNYRRLLTSLIKFFYFSKVSINSLKSNFGLSYLNDNLKKLEAFGYCFLNFSKNEQSKKLIDNVNEILTQKIKEKINKKEGKTQFDQYSIATYIYRHKYELLKNFFFLNNLYEDISNYIGFKPILMDMQIMHSYKNNFFLEDSAQLFHSDYEDNKSVKIFINLDDVSYENGPFTFIDKKDSELVAKTYNYSKSYKKRRLDDELIENLVHRNNFKNNVGEKYKGLVIDSTACLHYGSRLISGQRKLLQLYLVSPFCFNFDRSFYRFLKNNASLSAEKMFFSYLSKIDKA
jgi:hypothetical protein